MAGELADEIGTMIHAFGDKERRDGVRELAGKVRALEEERDAARALCAEAAKVIHQAAFMYDECCFCGVSDDSPEHVAGCHASAMIASLVTVGK